MTFTYRGDLTTDVDRVRFRARDTVESSGPRPESANFTDEELTGLIADEGSYQRAVAGIYEVLAAEWAEQVDVAAGSRREYYSQTSARYAQLAKAWRRAWGRSASLVGTRHPTRIDAYSDDISADEI